MLGKYLSLTLLCSSVTGQSQLHGAEPNEQASSQLSFRPTRRTPAAEAMLELYSALVLELRL